jgi:hypothetical protein
MAHELDRVADSLERLYGDGGLSEDSTDVLLITKGALEKIADGLGEVSSADELLLAAILVDDSTSIGPLISHIRHGHKLMLDVLKDERHSVHVQVFTRALNRGLIAPYEDIAHATQLTQDNFIGNDQVGKTPLYYQGFLTLGTVLTKAQEEEARGVKVRTFTLIITDGKDEFSGTATTAADVRVIVKDMLDLATNHIIAGMGIGEYCDFREVFREMGIPERSVYTARCNSRRLGKRVPRSCQGLAVGGVE